mgnify:CR=1 FL=1
MEQLSCPACTFLQPRSSRCSLCGAALEPASSTHTCRATACGAEMAGAVKEQQSSASASGPASQSTQLRQSPRRSAAAANARLPPPHLGVSNLRELATTLSAYNPTTCCPQVELPRQRAGWDCGYANINALCGTLSRLGLPLPSCFGARSAYAARGDVKPIQQLIEAAWRAGFDPKGAVDYRHALRGKVGKAGWIGGPEYVAMLWSLAVDAFVIEVEGRRGSGKGVYSVCQTFFSPPVPRGEKRRRGADAAGPASGTAGGGLGTRPPLILQGDGHSRLIVGLLREPERVLVGGHFDLLSALES